MADGARDSTFADLDTTVLWLRSASGHVPSYSDGQRGVPSRDPTGSRRGSDHTSVTVGDVSSLLDRSGCRMLMSGPASEG